MVENPCRTPGLENKRIKIYDFKRPDKFSNVQLHTIKNIHESAGRLMSRLLGADFGMPVWMNVVTVDQMCYEEFVRSVPNPTMLAVLDMNPLKGKAILEIDPALYCFMLDNLYGSPQEYAGRSHMEGLEGQDFSDADNEVLEGIIGKMSAVYSQAWSSVFDLKAVPVSIVNQPHFVQIVPPNEMIVLVTFEVRFGEIEQMMNFCLPFVTIEPVVNKLLPSYWYNRVCRIEENPGFVSACLDIHTPYDLVADAESLSVADLASLKRGSLVPLADEGIYSLDCGAKVIELEDAGKARRGKRKFRVKAGADLSEFSGKLGLADAKTEKDESSASAELMKKLENSLADLAARVGALASKQDSAFDTLLYGNDPSERKDASEGVYGVADSDASRRALAVRDALVWIESTGSETTAAFLGKERASLIALVLSRISESSAAEIIARLDTSLATRVVAALSRIGAVRPEVLAAVDHVFSRSFRNESGKSANLPGSSFRKALGILELVPREVEKSVIEGLEKSDPALSEEFKKNMFVFEDLVLLDDKALSRAFALADAKDIALTFKTAPDALKDRIRNAMEGSKRAEVEKLIADMGPSRMSDVDQAGQRIVEIVARMESEGLVFIARPDEPVV